MLQVPVAQQILRPHDRDLQLPAGQQMRELVLLAPTVQYGTVSPSCTYLALGTVGTGTVPQQQRDGDVFAQEQPYSYSYCSSGRGGGEF